MDIFTIAIFAAVFLAQLYPERASRVEGFPLRRTTKLLLMLSVAVVLVAAFYSAFARYEDWHEGALTKYLLPPHQDAAYFLADVGKEFFAPPLIAILAAVILPRVAWLLNRKYKERFFYNEEFDLMRLGIFLTGYPGFLLYLGLVLGAGFLLSTLFSLLSRGRAPMRWFWMPAGILTITLLNWVLPEIIAKRFAL